MHERQKHRSIERFHARQRQRHSFSDGQLMSAIRIAAFCGPKSRTPAQPPRYRTAFAAAFPVGRTISSSTIAQKIEQDVRHGGRAGAQEEHCQRQVISGHAEEHRRGKSDTAANLAPSRSYRFVVVRQRSPC